MSLLRFCFLTESRNTIQNTFYNKKIVSMSKESKMYWNVKLAQVTALGLSRRYLETPCQESVRALGCFIEMGRLFRANITEPLFELKFVMPEKRVSGILHPAVPRFGKTGASKLRTLSWSHSQVTLGRFVSTNGYSSCFCVHPPFYVHVSVWHLQWSTVDAVGRVLAHGHQLVFWDASGLSRVYEAERLALATGLSHQRRPCGPRVSYRMCSRRVGRWSGGTTDKRDNLGQEQAKMPILHQNCPGLFWSNPKRQKKVIARWSLGVQDLPILQSVESCPSTPRERDDAGDGTCAWQERGQWDRQLRESAS